MAPDLKEQIIAATYLIMERNYINRSNLVLIINPEANRELRNQLAVDEWYFETDRNTFAGMKVIVSPEVTVYKIYIDPDN